jgi:hypothetical protein
MFRAKWISDSFSDQRILGGSKAPGVLIALSPGRREECKSPPTHTEVPHKYGTAKVSGVHAVLQRSNYKDAAEEARNLGNTA